MQHLGDFKRGQSISFLWSTYAAAGQSITRATNGTVQVYRDGNVAQFTTGVTDTEDFDGNVGIHLCVIDTATIANYPAGSDYSVIVIGMTVDGQSLNAVLASFSIENRDRMVVSKGALDAGGAATFTIPSTGPRTGIKVGDVIRVPGKGQKFIDTYTVGTGVGTTRSNFGSTLAAADQYEVISAPDGEPIAAADYATDAISAAAMSAAAVTKIQTGLATSAAIGALPSNASIGAQVDASLSAAGVTLARMGSLDVNFTIVGSVLTVRNAAGATLFTRNLAVQARDALASAVPPP
jgi:hypothetical protein